MYIIFNTKISMPSLVKISLVVHPSMWSKRVGLGYVFSCVYDSKCFSGKRELKFSTDIAFYTFNELF